MYIALVFSNPKHLPPIKPPQHSLPRSYLIIQFTFEV